MTQIASPLDQIITKAMIPVLLSYVNSKIKIPPKAEHGPEKKITRKMHLKFPICDFCYSAATITKMAQLFIKQTQLYKQAH